METTLKKELSITRIFNAPKALVFRTWIEPKHMAQWWGPKGFTNPVCEMDARPGGAIRIDMTFPDGTPHPMTGKFNEIDEPNRLVFTCFAFMDADGIPQLEVINTITFTDHEGKTKLTMHAQVIKAGPSVADAIAGMDEGWNQSLDRLNELLEKINSTRNTGLKSGPLVIERTFNAPIQKVWSAITDKDEMKKWYFDLAAFKPEVGFEFAFTAGNENRKFVHLCKITEVIPGKKLSYSWRYEGEEGNSIVTFELFAEGDNTKLRLTHEGLETFPATPDFARKNFVEGWTAIIGTSLKQYLDK
jgi:uncharacterized protein YndB with AHSA1/START domain